MTIQLPDNLNAPDLLYAILTISAGVVMLGWGIRFFRTIVALSGFAASAVLAFIVLANVNESVGLGRHANAIMLGTSVLAGVLGAALGLWVWMLALGAIGGLGGLCAALWILSWPRVRESGMVDGPVERPLFIAGASLAGCILALIFEKAIIVAATSLSGSLAMGSGIDVFVHSGLNQILQAIIVNKKIKPTDDAFEPKTMAMLVSVGALFLVGVIFQYKVSGKERNKAKRSIMNH